MTHFDLIEPHKGCCIVKSNGRYNVMTDDFNLVCDKWYSSIKFLVNGNLLVTDENGLCNIMHKDGGFIGTNWYLSIMENDGYDNKFHVVQDKDTHRYTLLGYDGRQLSTMWFDDVDTGAWPNVRVRIGNEWFVLDEDFEVIQDSTKFINILSAKACVGDDVRIWRVGVIGNKRIMVLGEDYRPIDEELYDDTGDMEVFGIVVVKDRKRNVLTPDGRLLFDEWLDTINLRTMIVSRDGKFNVIRPDGTFVLERFAYGVYKEIDGVYRVTDGHKHNFFNYSGRLVLDEWVTGYSILGSVILVMNLIPGMRCMNLLSIDTFKLVSDEWFDVIEQDPEKDGLFYAKSGNMKRIVYNGKFLNDKWYGEVVRVSKDVKAVKDGDKWHLLNVDRNETVEVN